MNERRGGKLTRGARFCFFFLQKNSKGGTVKIPETLKNLWELARPIRRALVIFTLLLVVYEAAQILDSYVISGTIRLQENQISFRQWLLFFVLLLVYDEL